MEIGSKGNYFLLVLPFKYKYRTLSIFFLPCFLFKGFYKNSCHYTAHTALSAAAFIIPFQWLSCVITHAAFVNILFHGCALFHWVDVPLFTMALLAESLKNSQMVISPRPISLKISKEKACWVKDRLAGVGLRLCFELSYQLVTTTVCLTLLRPLAGPARSHTLR